jgi:hypothetical protein
MLEYQEAGQVQCWKFSGGGEALTVLYAEESPLKNIDAQGIFLFSTGDVDSGILPSYSMSVYIHRTGFI